VPSGRGGVNEARESEGGRPDLSLWCQSRMEEGGIVPPHSVLAPGSALKLLRSRALPSAQVNVIVNVGNRARNTKGDTEEAQFGPVVRSELPMAQLEIPPVWANSSRTVDAATSASNGRSQAARCSGWSGPYGEEFAPDKSASAETINSRAAYS